MLSVIERFFATGERPRVLWLRALWSGGWICACLSILIGVKNSRQHSQDFQWSPTTLLVHHIDPWKEFLAGNVAGRIILYQFPNYLHLLYLLLAPFGWMDFTAARSLWVVCNLLFTVIALLCVRKSFDLTDTGWGLTCIAFLCGTPFRNCLGNGQQTLLILCLVALAYRTRIAWKQGIWSGVSYFKYSFSVPLMFDLIFRRGLLAAAISVIPAFIGLMWAYWMLGERWMKLAVEPLLVSRTAIEGVGDLMSLVDVLLPVRGSHPILFLGLEYVLPLALAAVTVWSAHRLSKEHHQSRLMAAVCAVSALALFKHAFYNYAMLLFPFAYGMRYRFQRSGKGVLLGVMYLWFATCLFWRMSDGYGISMLSSNLIVLVSITALVLHLGRSARRQEMVAFPAGASDAGESTAGVA